MLNFLRKTDKPKSLKINIIMNALYQVLILVIPFITSPYISRVLLPEGVGSYSYAYSIVTCFVTIANFGFLDYGTVKIAQKRDNRMEYSKLFWELFYVKAILTAVVGLIYYGLVFGQVFINGSYSMNTMAVFLIMGVDILQSAFDITYLFQGLENFTKLCIRNAIIKLLNLALIFIFVRTSSDYLNYVIVMSVGLFLTGFSTLLALFNDVSFMRIHRLNFFRHLKDSFVFFVPAAAATLYYVIPKTLLGWMVSSSAVSGYYESADKLVNIVITLIGSLESIMTSRMSYLYEKKDYAEIERKTSQLFELYFLAVAPCFIGLIAINRFFTPGFFGTDYSEAIVLVYIMATKVVFNPIGKILSASYFVPFGKASLRAIILAIGTACDALLCFLLIHFYGVVGAAIGSSLAELISAILFLSFAKGKCHPQGRALAFIKSLDASLLMGIALYLLGTVASTRIDTGSSKSLVLLSVILIVIGVFIYAGCLLLFREKMVLSLVKRVFDKIRPKKKNG